jgi:hypothetical protein
LADILLVIPAERFLAALREQPGLALVLLRSIVGRLRDADRKRAEFTALDVVGRVAHRLVELAERFGESADDGMRFNLPISQRELAGWVGSSPRMPSAVSPGSPCAPLTRRTVRPQGGRVGGSGSHRERYVVTWWQSGSGHPSAGQIGGERRHRPALE